MTAKIILHLPVWWWKKCSWWWLLKYNRCPCEEGESMKQIQHHASSFDNGNTWHVAWWFDGQSVMVAWPMSDDYQCTLIKKLVALIRLSRESAGGRWSKSIVMRTFLTLEMCCKSWLFDGQSVIVVRAMSAYHQWAGLIRPRCWKWLWYHMTPWLLLFWLYFVMIQNGDGSDACIDVEGYRCYIGYLQRYHIKYS